jgi:hypothetical protein
VPPTTRIEAGRGGLLREAGGVPAQGLRRRFDQARATLLLLEQRQTQRVQPIGCARVECRPDPCRAEVEAMRAIFRGHTEDAPADTLAGFQQRGAQTQPLQQPCGHQARQASSDDHDLRRGTQSLGYRRRRIRLVCIHRAGWRRRHVGRDGDINRSQLGVVDSMVGRQVASCAD